TLKLRPLPETQALLTLGCDPAGLAPLLDTLHGTRTRPTCLDVLSAGAARAVVREAGVALPEAPWVVVAGFEDSEEAVGWQVRQLIKESSAAGVRGLEARAGAAADPLWRALAELVARPSARLTFKANLLPGAVADFCLRAGADEFLLHAHAGSGVVRGHAVGDLTLGRACAMLKGLTERAAAAQGNVVL